ncbi:MAG: hypothetical protein J6D30_05265 [Clostridia bacterium]|nr:hypothetical protein [Clostridia bacterium]
MLDRKKQQPQQFETSKIDALYSWLSYDLQRMKGELLSELKFSSAQVGSLYQELQNDKANSSRAITQEIRFSYKQNQTIYDGLATLVKDEISGRMDAMEEKLATLESVRALGDELVALTNGVSEKVDAVSAKQALLDKIDAAIAALPTEGVDYNRITAEVGDKVLELLNAEKANQESALETLKADVINGTAEKVVESMPYPEKVDYDRIAEIAQNAAMAAVEKALAALDFNAFADVVAAKLAEREQRYEIMLDEEGINQIAEKVSAKLDYDKVCQAAQAGQTPPQSVDYDRIADIVEDKLATEETDSAYDLVVDQDGIDAIAKGVAEQLGLCPACEEEPAPVEEEPVVEELAVSEADIDDSADEASTNDELAVAFAAVGFDEINNQLVDAETGLVIRLKKSFTAKMKQSEERVKGYYSDLKNELISYKKINSNVSWHGDRFNYGRDTVAKINICGKTLCFYVALDPNDPELKSTVYHQKDVGGQKAYESTPFMVKVKSDSAAKKALRLVGYLAEKVGAEKDEKFEAVDYVEKFAYESTKQLFEEGYIKATKEKKVELDF